MLIKRFSIILLCCIIAFCPLIALCDYSYAEDVNDEIWQHVQTKEQIVAAWKSYLNSRNIAHSGNPVSALISWDYDTLDNILSTTGHSMEELQAGLYYTLRNSSGLTGSYLRFRYSTSAWSILNQIYTKFAIQNGISKDENSSFDKTLINGEYFVDDDGYGCFVFQSNKLNFISYNQTKYDNYVSFTGTKYRFEGLSYYSDVNIPNEMEYTLNVGSDHINYSIIRTINDDSQEYSVCIENNYFLLNNGFYLFTRNRSFVDGYLCIIKYNNEYYLGNYRRETYDNENSYTLYCHYKLPNYQNATDASVSIATAGLRNAIDALGNVVEVEPKNKNTNQGYSSIEDYLEDDSSEAEGNNTEIPDNDINTPEEPSNPSAGSTPTGGFQLPDGSFNFKMPELNINWSLDGLQNKFPLSIPWDMIRIASALDAPAATPEFDFTVNFTRYTHRFQFDLHDFDTIMGYFRIAIEVLYTFGLIVATRQIFHIY